MPVTALVLKGLKVKLIGCFCLVFNQLGMLLILGFNLATVVWSCFAEANFPPFIRFNANLRLSVAHKQTRFATVHGGDPDQSRSVQGQTEKCLKKNHKEVRTYSIWKRSISRAWKRGFYLKHRWSPSLQRLQTKMTQKRKRKRTLKCCDESVKGQEQQV